MGEVNFTDKNNYQWQPIETAPRDGSDVLLTDGVNIENCYYNKEYKCSEGWWVVSCSDNWGFACVHEAQPTHWMPLPKPPKEVENADKNT